MGAKQTSTEKAAGHTLKGAVLEVLKSLLQSGRSDAVVALVEKLVSRNSELEQRLAQLLSRGHKNEGVERAAQALRGRTVGGGWRGGGDTVRAGDREREAEGRIRHRPGR